MKRATDKRDCEQARRVSSRRLQLKEALSLLTLYAARGVSPHHTTGRRDGNREPEGRKHVRARGGVGGEGGGGDAAAGQLEVQEKKGWKPGDTTTTTYYSGGERGDNAKYGRVKLPREVMVRSREGEVVKESPRKGWRAT